MRKRRSEGVGDQRPRINCAKLKEALLPPLSSQGCHDVSEAEECHLAKEKPMEEQARPRPWPEAAVAEALKALEASVGSSPGRRRIRGNIQRK